MSEVPPPQVVMMPLMCSRCGQRGEVELRDYPQPGSGTLARCTCRCGVRETRLPIQLIMGLTIRADSVEIMGVPLDFDPTSDNPQL
jgi:hypothetical protein